MAPYGSKSTFDGADFDPFLTHTHTLFAVRTGEIHPNSSTQKSSNSTIQLRSDCNTHGCRLHKLCTHILTKSAVTQAASLPAPNMPWMNAWLVPSNGHTPHRTHLHTHTPIPVTQLKKRFYVMLHLLDATAFNFEGSISFIFGFVTRFS